MHTKFWTEDLGVDGRMRWEVGLDASGAAGGGPLWALSSALGLRGGRGVFWLAGWHVLLREGLCSMDLPKSVQIFSVKEMRWTPWADLAKPLHCTDYVYFIEDVPYSRIEGRRRKNCGCTSNRRLVPHNLPDLVHKYR